MNTTSKISSLSRLLLFMCSIMLAISVFVPIWRIDLDAPQYPEGLRLLIHADKLGGNVDIINGLNHYIGMKTLHADEFIEFKILPYIIMGFALLSLVAGIVARKRMLYILFSLFVLFGIVAMVDFWRWEYDYGHNLDPNAAIIVPGMAYQPPLIGFKQLLNFGAYSIPAAGGWLFVASGLFMLAAIIRERYMTKKIKMNAAAMLLAASAIFTACSENKPEPVKLNSDNCDYCRMTISDGRFAAQFITDKGRVYKFDDLSCMQNYKRENEAPGKSYVAEFPNANNFIPADNAFYVTSEAVASPMGGNTAAFSEKQKAEEHAQKLSAEVLTYKDIKL